MAKKHKYHNESSSSPLLIVLLVVMAVFIALALGLRALLMPSAPSPAPNETITIETTAPAETQAPKEEKLSFWQRLFGKKETEPEETLPEPEHVVSQAVISVTGDILMHMPVISTGLQADGSYNFDSIFQYLLPYSSGADFAIANLETTLCGTDGGYKYSGYPAFNCPDEIVDSLKKAGFDMLLTANNHCYDTSEYGFLRTVNRIREKGLLNLGTAASADEAKYTIQEINGIRVGMVCYTYEGPPEKPVAGKIYMNRNAMSDTTAQLINSFLPTNLDAFYMEIRAVMEQMKQAGAEATMMFIHWGTEYQTVPNSEQQNIAQQLCDLGFDVIVGGHPHVIQPVSLLSSRLNPDHKTVCLYSTGNAVSNQRINEMDLKTGHTEDALLFSITFSKYSDGTVYLEGADLLPCWVDMRTEGSKEYDMIPLNIAQQEQWAELYSLSTEAYENAQKSYNRTNDLTMGGMLEVQNYLTAQIAQREADYLAAVTPLADAA